MPLALDPCSGSRMWWFDRQHPAVIYGDKRREQHILCDGRTLRIEPDFLMDFRALPFADGAFKLVAFDPPHLVRAGPKSWMAAKYGKLSESWRDDMSKGFAECFRVLATHGVLVFKWNEVQVPIKEILALTPHQPMFGNTSGKRAAQSHWIVFMKTGTPSKPVPRSIAEPDKQESEPSPSPSPSAVGGDPVEHGVNCNKTPHYGVGYLHDENDDAPYNVDGVIYCGRCHLFIGGR